MLELSANTVAVHRANIMQTLGIHNTAELVVYAIRNGPGEHRVTRRSFLLGAAPLTLAAAAPSLGFRLTDVTARAGIHFRHNSGAFGAKYLPETMGPGCAFFDYDARRLAGHSAGQRHGLAGSQAATQHAAALSQQPQRHVHRCHERAGLAVEMYGMGVAVGDYDNDGFPDILITAVGQNRLFHNTGRGHFIDVTERPAWAAAARFSTSAMWFDYDRDGFLDLLSATT